MSTEDITRLAPSYAERIADCFVKLADKKLLGALCLNNFLDIDEVPGYSLLEMKLDACLEKTVPSNHRKLVSVSFTISSYREARLNENEYLGTYELEISVYNRLTGEVLAKTSRKVEIAIRTG